MRKSRDLERTREALMKAGLAEFSGKGLAGARTDAIARRAGVNKRMLFYCFGSKQGLYREVLRRKLEEKERVIESLPDDIVDGLMQMYDAGCADLDWVRMLEWEALASTSRAVIGEEDRRKLFETALGRLRKADGEGAVAPGADLPHLFVSLLAVSFFPLAFPQMIRLITGRAPTEAGFKEKHREFLRWLGERLRGTGEAKAGAHDAEPDAIATRARIRRKQTAQSHG